MKLEAEFREFIEYLNAREVRYLVVGGYAVAAHGLPRATKDFDVWVWIGPGNVERLLAALDDFGFGQVGLAASDFDHADSVVQLGYPPVRIDILTSIDGVDFADAYPRRMEAFVDGLPVAFIGRDDLIRNKRAAGRPQDVADAERLSPDRG